MTAPEPLSSRAQALLDAARGGLGPDDAAIARMRAKVLAAAGGAGVTAGATAAKAGMSLAAKAAIVAVVAGVIGAGSWWMLRDGGGGGRAGGEGKHEVMVAERAKVEEAAPVVVEPVPVSVRAPVEVQESEQPATGNRRPATGNRTPRTHTNAGASGGSLAAEVALVDDAMAALRRDDPRAALAAADDHVARFGRRGQLAEEAAAIRVEALCRLGDSRWSAAFDAFDAQFPGSAQRPRLTAACKGVP
jgi:hypothetical protein